MALGSGTSNISWAPIDLVSVVTSRNLKLRLRGIVTGAALRKFAKPVAFERRGAYVTTNAA